MSERDDDGADHYVHDRFDELKAAIRRYFTEGDGARVVESSSMAGLER